MLVFFFIMFLQLRSGCHIFLLEHVASVFLLSLIFAECFLASLFKLLSGRIPVRLYVRSVSEDFDDLEDAPQIDSWDQISYLNRPVDINREGKHRYALYNLTNLLLGFSSYKRQWFSTFFFPIFVWKKGRKNYFLKKLYNCFNILYYTLLVSESGVPSGQDYEYN